RATSDVHDGDAAVVDADRRAGVVPALEAVGEDVRDALPPALDVAVHLVIGHGQRSRANRAGRQTGRGATGPRSDSRGPGPCRAATQCVSSCDDWVRATRRERRTRGMAAPITAAAPIAMATQPKLRSAPSSF